MNEDAASIIARLHDDNARKAKLIDELRETLNFKTELLRQYEAPQTANSLVEFCRLFFQKALALMVRKNADYAGDVDPLLNFNLGRDLGVVTTEQGVAVRWFDKLQRVANLINRDAKVKDETIEDTLIDWANYAAILAFALMQKRRAK